MKITEQTTIFKNDKGYSTSISNKKEDGNYDNMYISVNFRKGVEVPDKTKINILNGFLSFYKTKDGLLKPKIVVMDFEEVKREELSQSDLPF